MNKLLFIIGAICFIAVNDAASVSSSEQKFTLRGRVLFPSGSKTPVESDGQLTVELVDTSLADAPATVIAEGKGKAIRFPMAFTIKYSSKQISAVKTYSLRVSIKSKTGKLLYTNDAHIGVTLLGLERTKLIDVPVILVKKTFVTLPIFKTRSWPKLIGKAGQDVVDIIKKETGFTNVKTIKEGTPVTKDYSSSRVRIFVNDQGIVTRIPTVA